MYSRKSWGGAMDPFILTKFISPKSMDDVDPIVSIVVFEWRDKDLIGVPVEGENGEMEVRSATRKRTVTTGLT